MRKITEEFSERRLVSDATVSLRARALLKRKLRPYIVEATRDFIKSRGIPLTRESELVEVGIEPFERVFNIYMMNSHNLLRIEGHFYMYYIWWMRQAIVSYLEADRQAA